MTINRQWLLAKRPDGMIGPDNFQYTETAIPEPGDGEVLVRNLYFSFDPTQRNWMVCLLYTSPSPRDAHESRMPSSA